MLKIENSKLRNLFWMPLGMMKGVTKLSISQQLSESAMFFCFLQYPVCDTSVFQFLISYPFHHYRAQHFINFLFLFFSSPQSTHEFCDVSRLVKIDMTNTSQNLNVFFKRIKANFGSEQRNSFSSHITVF